MMPLYVIVNGQKLQVPREIAVKGGTAIDEFLKKQKRLHEAAELPKEAD
jgi:hypothetical protein